MLSSFSEKDKICAGYTKADFIVGGEMEGSALYRFANIENVPGVVIKGICDWGVAKNDIFPDDPEREELFKNSLQAYAMSQAVKKCSLLLKDAELFSEPKQADTKLLMQQRKRNRIVIISVMVIMLTLTMYKLLNAIGLFGAGAQKSLDNPAMFEVFGLLLLTNALFFYLFFERQLWKRHQNNRYNISQEIEKNTNGMYPEGGHKDLANGYFEEMTQ